MASAPSRRVSRLMTPRTPPLDTLFMVSGSWESKGRIERSDVQPLDAQLEEQEEGEEEESLIRGYLRERGGSRARPRQEEQEQEQEQERGYSKLTQ